MRCDSPRFVAGETNGRRIGGNGKNRTKSPNRQITILMAIPIAMTGTMAPSDAVAAVSAQHSDNDHSDDRL
jgi:hypothetical protein